MADRPTPLSAPLLETMIGDLLDRQNPDGGWGSAAAVTSNSESTALAVLALRQSARDAVGAQQRGLHWLLAHQSPNGGWSFFADGPEVYWPTPIVLLALRGTADSAAASQRGLDWLMSERGRSAPLKVRIRDFISRNRVNELDTTLDGWPWVPDTFAWVEPTSWALLALKVSVPRATRAVRSRIREGEDMILDRACPEGGWNYGNKRVLGEELEPYPDTTALALLALKDRPAPEVESGFRSLDGMLGEHASGLSLALAALSHRAWGRDAAILGRRIETSVAAADYDLDTRTVALAALALAPGIEWLEARET